MNHLDDASKASYVRSNLPFQPGESIRLDDTSKIEYLMHSVRVQKNLPQKCQSIAFSLLASAFYFELEEKPSFHAGGYEVSGLLRCRFDARKIFRTIRRCSATVEVVSDSTSYGFLDEVDICQTCLRFTLQMKFRISQTKDVVDIRLITTSDGTHTISGSGNTVQWYVDQQQLDASFGKHNHGAPGRRACSQCISLPVHRAIGISPGELALKKRKDATDLLPRRRIRVH